MDENSHSEASEFSLVDRTFIHIKQFELILGKMQEGDVEDDEFWEEMWRVVPGLSLAELKFLRQELVHDFEKIESGQFQLPIYSDDLVSSRSNPSDSQRNATAVGKKRGKPWSEEEKALFVEGLKKYGKGRWKEISKYFVTSRTATQVASHGQKFFLAEEKKLERLGISHLPHRHQESSPAPHFPIRTTSQIPPQQHGFEAPSAPEYLLGNQYYGERNLPNFISLPPWQSNHQALPPYQFNQRVHPGALVPDPAYRLQHQPHQTGYMNQTQHLMHSRNSTQRQFYQQTAAEPLFLTQQTLDVLQSRTSFVNLHGFASWSITSNNAAPISGSDFFPLPTRQQSPNSRMDQNHKNTDWP